MTKRASREIEFKWAVKSSKDFTVFLRHAKKLGARIGPAKKISITDTYLDSTQAAFSKKGIKTRVRCANQTWELTQKHMSALQKGLAKRRETTIRLPRFQSVIKAIHHVWGKFLKKSLAGEHVVTLFTIQNKRTVRKLKISKQTQAELCFDRAIISRGKKSFEFKEIELELKKGKFSDFAKFTTALTRSSGLKPAKISKVATSLKTFGLKR